MGWHLTGSEDEVAAGDALQGPPSHRPSISHGLGPELCTRCQKRKRKGPMWCSACVEHGNGVARASIHRQVAAGMPVPRRNWRPGDPRWWLASGCYKEKP